MNKAFFSILILLVFTQSALRAQHESIQWMSMDEVEAAMKKEPRKILIDVYTPWCGPCKMMANNTFTNPQIVEYINQNYYAVKFNAEGSEDVTFLGTTYTNPQYDPARGNGRNGTHEFTMAVAPVNGRVAYPTIVYMDESFKILSPVQGYMQPDQIMPILHFFGDNAYLDQSWSDYSTSYSN
jgi:thioredoxin-related protein